MDTRDVVTTAVMLGLAALMFLAWYLQRRGQATLARRVTQYEAWAQSSGWTFERGPGTVAFRIRGRSGEGVDWELYYDTHAMESGTNAKLGWRASSLATREPEFVTTTPALFSQSRNPVYRKLRQAAFAVKDATGRGEANAEPALFEAFARPTTEALHKRWVYACRDPDRCDRIFGADIERLLSSFPKSAPTIAPGGTLLASLDARGLTIEIESLVGEEPVARHLLKLGEALAARIAA